MGTDNMETSFTDNYDKSFLLDTMMGPNAMRVTEELASFLPIEEGMRILDLGCGMGISSILLAQKYKATVFAADLLVSPTNNYKRFASLGLADRVFPIFMDATKPLPFAAEYFDMLICVGSFHYFGANKEMLPHLLPCVKRGGHIGVAVPGLKCDLSDDAKEKLPFDIPNVGLYSLSWWQDLWRMEGAIRLGICREMRCVREAWEDWLTSQSPFAQQAVPEMLASVVKYFNLVQMIGQKI